MLTIHKKNISWLCLLLTWNTFMALGQTVISGTIREASGRKVMPEVICMLTDASGRTMLTMASQTRRANSASARPTKAIPSS